MVSLILPKFSGKLLAYSDSQVRAQIEEIKAMVDWVLEGEDDAEPEE